VASGGVAGHMGDGWGQRLEAGSGSSARYASGAPSLRARGVEVGFGSALRGPSQGWTGRWGPAGRSRPTLRPAPEHEASTRIHPYTACRAAVQAVQAAVQAVEDLQFKIEGGLRLTWRPPGSSTPRCPVHSLSCSSFFTYSLRLVNILRFTIQHSYTVQSHCIRV
jgi:hypothetical protein